MYFTNRNFSFLRDQLYNNFLRAIDLKGKGWITALNPNRFRYFKSYCIYSEESVYQGWNVDARPWGNKTGTTTTLSLKNGPHYFSELGDYSNPWLI